MVKSLISNNFLLQLDDLVYELDRFSHVSTVIDFHDFWDIVCDCTNLCFDYEAMSYFMKTVFCSPNFFVSVKDLVFRAKAFRSEVFSLLYNDFFEEGEEGDV